jgi:hypothetical protein
MNRKGSWYGLFCTATDGTLNDRAVSPSDSSQIKMVSRFRESSLPSKMLPQSDEREQVLLTFHRSFTDDRRHQF